MAAMRIRQGRGGFGGEDCLSLSKCGASLFMERDTGFGRASGLHGFNGWWGSFAVAQVGVLPVRIGEHSGFF